MIAQMLKKGILAAVLMIAYRLLEYALGYETQKVEYSQFLEVMILMVPVLVMITANWREKEKYGEEMGWRGLWLGLGITAVCIVLVGAYTYVHANYISTEQGERLARFISGRSQQMGLEGDHLQEAMAQAKAMYEPQAQLIRFVMRMSIVGIVLSVLMGIFGKK